jgi:hypothetical protein
MATMIDFGASRRSSVRYSLVGADLVGTESLRRLAEVVGEAGDLLDVRLLRVRREIPEAHVLQHALAQWCHGGDSINGGRR